MWIVGSVFIYFLLIFFIVFILCSFIFSCFTVMLLKSSTLVALSVHKHAYIINSSIHYIYIYLPLQRVHLDVQIGEQAINYPEVASREKLGELQLRIRQLLDQIEQITKEQAYQRVGQTYLHFR